MSSTNITRASSSPQNFGHPFILEEYIPVPEPTTDTKLCGVCHAPAHDNCSGCKNILYCSTACQTRGWALHKLLCKPYIKLFDTNERPGPKFRRALYFPVDAAKPRFVYHAFGDDGTMYGMARCFPGTPERDIKTVAFHNRYLPYFIQLSYDTNPESKRELKENSSLGLPFCGPVVALAYDPETALSAPPLDVDTTVLRPLIEYVKLRAEYGGPVFVEVSVVCGIRERYN
ncbi:hypothetical protein EJ02DRAFT_87387 [Clathrospora elynae]|uniref:MYND-type domain-containing protein n=1 Tax=Clathrospora elynae TaxID=706981 RepID=A0A6A5SG90_9PLEO|nr:hypothetical protein EJ02DRAFT_87387 [Clathrospora elynae]